jgi:hypothetical protein
MKQKGKFQLFTLYEFADWLMGLEVHRKIKIIQNHHTYLPDYKSFRKHPDHFTWMDSMEASHKERGFDQIAQQLTTFPDGLICVGRPFDVVPAGIKGANLNGICIENLGNFDKGGDEMTDEHRNTIVSINAMLCKRFELHPDIHSIVYHHWYDLNTGSRVVANTPASTKSCPGTNFFGGNTEDDCLKNFLPLVNKLIGINGSV